MFLKTISKSKGAHPSKEGTQDKVYTLWRLIRVRHRSETTHRWTQSGDDRQEARLTHKRKLWKTQIRLQTLYKAGPKHQHGHETWTEEGGTNRSANINKYNDWWELKHRVRVSRKFPVKNTCLCLDAAQEIRMRKLKTRWTQNHNLKNKTIRHKKTVRKWNLIYNVWVKCVN